MNVKGSIVAITGAGGGLGSAMARHLAQGGARLALVDAKQDPLTQLVERLGLRADDCLPLVCDVTDEDRVDQTFETIADHFGGLDILVNNAGITRDALMLKFKDGERISRMSLADWQAVIDVNLTGVFLCARAAVEHMARFGNGGLIVNISSISRAGNMGQSNYSASKAAVAALTVTWAKEFIRYGVRVNTISPGFIRTEMVKNMKPEALAKLTGMIPAGRVGEPEEIAHALQFLIENEFVNGRNIEIDGALRL